MSIRMMTVFLLGVAACSPAPRLDPELRGELVERAATDQDQMQSLVANWSDSSYHRQLRSTLQANTVWLDSVVAERGWPGYAVADSAGSRAAFLITQHADALPEAQRRLLVALRAAVEQKQAAPRDLAYLEDRVRKADGLPQLYGTQPDYDSTATAIQPRVEAPESLDVRRAAVGLTPMAEYLDTLRAANERARPASVVPR